jgi:tetratricopeptide (TPR) repeat protein
VLASRSRVVSRSPALLVLLVALAAAGAPERGAAQVAQPRLVEDGDEPAEEPAAAEPARPARERSAPGPSSVPPARTAAMPSAGVPGGPGAAVDGVPADLPPPPPPTATIELARRILPVASTRGELDARWVARRTALREGDPARGEAETRALLAAQRDLGIENLVPFAAAEIRESARALAANLPADAILRAETAVQLAPDFPDAHLALARARFAQSGALGPAVGPLRDAFSAATREPHTLRAFYGDVLGAGLAAVFTAAAATILLLLARRIRLFLHDFHHLPLLRGTASIQTGFLALVLLAMPVAFGLGPFATLAVAALAVWLYLGRAERLVVTAALLALVALPWAAGEAARVTAWTGSGAERIHELEHGAVSDEDAAALAAAAPASAAPAPLLAALGRHAKRRGDLDAARRLYQAAAAADPRAPEVLVNLGNVLFLKGDLDAAKAAYLSAQDQAGADLVVLGAAHYDLSKLYLRTSEMDKAAAAREKAEREAGAFLRAHGSDEDFAANRYLVDVPVPEAKIAALAAGDGSPEAVRAWVRARLAGALPRTLWPWGGVGFVGFLWLLALVARRLAPARPCGKCGRAACGRCDGAPGPLCGQCVNVFQRKGMVDARDRLRKEAQVRRHAHFVRTATRVLSVAGPGAGQIFHGAAARGALILAAVLFSGFVVWFWRGIMPSPQPSPYVLAGKIALAAPLGVALWAVAIRDAFKRTRS